VQDSAGKIMATECGESEGILLEEFLKRRATINSERYVQTLTKLKNEFEGFGLRVG
jgi:hypothetical protein